MDYNENIKPIQFPEGFLWGTAIAAHQVEGGNRNQWSEWEKSLDRTNYLIAMGIDPKDYISGQACDHYNRFEADFDLARGLNNNAHRFSIEWSRIEPEENRIDVKEIEHYRRVIKALKSRGLEPFVTLWHWTVPVWFADKGGFEKRNNIIYFVRFCERMAKEFGKDVKFWITINEPMIYTSSSYWHGNWPPQKKSVITFFRVSGNLVQAHRRAYDVMHDAVDGLKIVIAKNNVYFEGWLAPIASWFWNQRFLNRIQDYQDFIGFNYYFHRLIKGFDMNAPADGPKNDLGWEIYPEGIYHTLKELKHYGKTVYITENGIADAKDERRAAFIVNHLRWVHKAIQEGVDVRGYFHWSLLDNFEWAHGFGPRFGLFEVDYKTQERRPRPSSRIYGQISAANGITEELIAKTGGQR